MFDDFVEHAHNSDSAGPGGNQVFASSSAGQNRFEDVGYEGFEPSPFSDDEYDATGDEQDYGAGGIEALETGYIPNGQFSSSSNIFTLGHVQFTLPSALLHLRCANNILFLALHPLTLIIIDLSRPSELTTIEIPAPKIAKGSTGRGGGVSRESGSILGIWPDGEGKHLIVGCEGGENYYLSKESGPEGVWRKPKASLKLLKPLGNVTSLSWSPRPPPSEAYTFPSSSSSSSTRDCLVGTSSGQLAYLSLQPGPEDLFKSNEKEMVVLWKFEAGSILEEIEWGVENDGDGGLGKRAWVLVISKGGGEGEERRAWEFLGRIGGDGKNGKWVEDVMKGYGKDNGPRLVAIPSPSSPSTSPTTITRPSLSIYNPTPSSISNVSPRTLAWLTPSGISSASLSASNPFSNLKLTPIPTNSHASTSSASSSLIDFTLTPHHYLVLFSDRLLAISRLDERLIWEEKIPLKSSSSDRPLGLSTDPSSPSGKPTHWLYTTSAIFEIVTSEEDRDVWRVLLRREEFDQSVRFAKTASQKSLVLSLHADSLFSLGRFHPAAVKYAECANVPTSHDEEIGAKGRGRPIRGFEEVVLRFVDAGERDAMRHYLGLRLDGLKKGDLMQRMMLATWLVEIYLSKCDTLEDLIAAEAASQDVESLQLERRFIEDELKQFLTDYQSNLDRKTIYDLFLSHGRTDLYVHFATVSKDYGKVAEHYILEEQWLKAVDVLNRQSSSELHYRFSPILMRNAPKETVDSWLRQSALDPRRLIPSLLQQSRPSSFSSPSAASTDQDLTTHAVRYLHYVVFKLSSTDPTIHNLLLTFLCSSPRPSSSSPTVASNTPTSDAALLSFLASAPSDPATERPYYDLDYALRLCMTHSRVRACAHIYSEMGLWESSVDLALEKGDIELAMSGADKPPVEDEGLRKKLWLKIAKYVVQDKKDIKTAMNFLSSTDLLKIEDILPFFPDFVVIDEFKSEICLALESCASHIASLKGEMDDATRSADAIKRDIDALKDRFVTVEMEETCVRCEAGLMTRQFYVFPCGHGFHADCLIKQIKEYAPSSTLRRILALQQALIKACPHSSSSGPANQLVSSTRALLSSSTSPSTATAADAQNSSSASNNRARLVGNPLSGLVLATDRLRELIVPDALASAITGSLSFSSSSGKKESNRREKSEKAGGIGSGMGGSKESRMEKIREELDELLAGSCVLCDSVVAGLDKPFVAEGEEEEGDWVV